jgi:hypothetical protein
MENNETPPSAERPAVKMRTMEIVVAALFFLGGAVVAFDSYRLGARWGEDGPQSGYFPFYIGLIICFSSVVTLVQAIRGKSDAAFVEWEPLKRVLAVLLPAIAYVIGIQFAGIYVASAVYIAVFMIWLGKYSWPKASILGVGAAAGFFLLFEVWFKVPLPKGYFDLLGFLGY